MPYNNHAKAAAYQRAYQRAHRPDKIPEGSSRTRTYEMLLRNESGLSGEELFVAAFLRLMVVDARRQGPTRAINGIRPSDPEAARAFLRDTEAVRFWAELLGANVEVIQARLLREAGMIE